MKKRYFLLVVPVAYALGFATVQFKVFPFEQIRMIRNMITMESVLSIRFEDMSGLTRIDVTADDDDRLVYLTYGQSNAANTGQLGYEVSQPVFMVYDGLSYKYEDPALGATGVNGSVWGRVGDMLIENGAAGKVFFVNAAWGSASMEELAVGHPFGFFERQLVQALDTFAHIDGILFHHGERHNKKIKMRPNIGSSTYRRDFDLFLSKIRKLTEAPVYMSLVSYCGDRGFDTDVTDIQYQIITELDSVYLGPNSDSLTDAKYRLTDQCHFSAAGFDALAERWVSSILASSER